MPFSVQKASNDALANCGPLSLTKVAGKPNRAKMSLRINTVAVVVVLRVGMISGHFE